MAVAPAILMSRLMQDKAQVVLKTVSLEGFVRLVGCLF
jgi:hypothetical protein